MSITPSKPKKRLVISVHLCDPDRVRVRTDGPFDPEMIKAICPETTDDAMNWYRQNADHGIDSHLCG